MVTLPKYILLDNTITDKAAVGPTRGMSSQMMLFEALIMLGDSWRTEKHSFEFRQVKTRRDVWQSGSEDRPAPWTNPKHTAMSKCILF